MTLCNIIIIICLSLVCSIAKVSANELKALENPENTSKIVNELYKNAYELIDQNNDKSFSSARKKLEKLIELDPDFSRAYLELARLEMKTRWPEGLYKAEKQILIAKSIDIDLADTNILLGYVYTNLNRFSDAELLYKDAEKTGTKNLWLYANWGLNFERQNKSKEAINQYYKVLKSPSRIQARNVRPHEWVYQYSRLYSMLSELGRIDEADKLYTKNAREFPYKKCIEMRQAKHRLYSMNNVQMALVSIKSARQKGCERNKNLLSIAHYMEWADLKKHPNDKKAAAIALRKAQAFSPDDDKLILALLESDKTIHLISVIEGLDINYRDVSGYTALSNVVSNASVKSVEILLSLGADPNIDFTELTAMTNPLIIATLQNNTQMIKFLLKNGADSSKKIRNGYSIADLMRQYGLGYFLSKKEGT